MKHQPIGIIDYFSPLLVLTALCVGLVIGSNPSLSVGGQTVNSSSINEVK